tara:strand:+ start:165038 stop:166120 length:1083 start_codon:yes stop_codon:yes gene_type:complete
MSFGLILAPACSQAQEVSEAHAATLRAALDAAAPGMLETYEVPSVAVAYIEDGALAWTAVYGQQGPDTPAGPDTLYNIASMTKPLTAETVLRLVSAGQMRLDDRLAEYWVDPDIAANPWNELLTAEINLSHRTGLPNWRYQTDDVLEFQAEPGTTTGYSGEGYDYLGHYLENRFETGFAALVAREVFVPIGMNETGFVRPDDAANRVAVPMGPDGEWGEPAYSDPWSAADNVYTTIGDYARFMIAVMHNEGIDADLARSRLQIRENLMANGCPLPAEHCPQNIGFGLGWSMFEYADARIVTHGGADWGERTVGLFDPEAQTGLIIFTNGANGGAVIHDIAELMGVQPDFTAFLAFQASNG